MFENIFGNKKSQPAQPKAPAQPAGRAAPAATPAPAAPSAPPTPPPALLGPLDIAKGASEGADFQSVVDEAAINFASGEEKDAAEMLIRFLTQTKGNADRRVWYVLLDIYHAQGERKAFEDLGLHFANRFGTSPPSWTLEEEAQERPAAPGGRNVLILEGGVNDALMGRSKDFIAAAREAKACKVDISRLKMEMSDLNGFNALQWIMSQLRKHRVSATLMGENHVANWLKKKVESTKERADIADSPYWLLLLEILQWRGLMEEFEDLSLDYTMTFEVSGPGWEPQGAMTIESVAEVADEQPSEIISPDSVVTEASVQRMQEAIAASLAERGEAKIDFHRVTRMDFMSAGAFLTYVSGLGDQSRQISLLGPSELILALLDVVGLTPMVRVVARKR